MFFTHQSQAWLPRREPGYGGHEAGVQGGGQPVGAAHRRPVPSGRVARVRLHPLRHIQIVSTRAVVCV